MRRRKNRPGRINLGYRNNRIGEHRLIEWQVVRRRGLRGELSVSISAGNVAQWELRHVRIGVQCRLHRSRRYSRLRLPPGFQLCLIFRRQDFLAPQIFIAVNVLRFLRVFSRAFLPRRFRHILRSSCPALRSPRK
jgi:hypothetical protein